MKTLLNLFKNFNLFDFLSGMAVALFFAGVLALSLDGCQTNPAHAQTRLPVEQNFEPEELSYEEQVRRAEIDFARNFPEKHDCEIVLIDGKIDCIYNGESQFGRID